MIPSPEIGLGKTGTAAAAATGIAGSKAGQPAGAAASGNMVLYGDSEVGVAVQLYLYTNSHKSRKPKSKYDKMSNTTG